MTMISWKILGLGSDHKDFVNLIQAYDTPLPFDELYKKLPTFNAHQKEKKPYQMYFPSSANSAHHNNMGNYYNLNDFETWPKMCVTNGW